MKSKQLIFFATFEDVKPILEEIEKELSIKYCLANTSSSLNIPMVSTISLIPDIGFVSNGDWNRIDRYLILKDYVNLNVREIIQNKGGINYAIDQMNNPNSIEMKFGGIYKFKNNVIVAGRISTISEAPDSIEIYKLFSNKIRKLFIKKDSFYVGQIAFDRLKEGWRLVMNEALTKEFDLK